MDTSLFWFILGIALITAELLMPGFIVIFFGIGALITAVISYLGVTDNTSIQLVIFLTSSILSLIIFRKKWSSSFKGEISRKMQLGEALDNIKGKKAVVKEDILPNKLKGRVEYNGTLWEAEADEMIEAGEVIEIIERNNLILKVRKIKN